MYMRTVKISNKYILREDGKLFDFLTKEEFIPKPKKAHNADYFTRPIKINNKTTSLHQLVMKTFGEPCPGKGYVIEFIDGNHLNCDINNLKWVTRLDRMSRMKNALPIGQRLCDFETKAEYNSKRSVIYHRNNPLYVTYVKKWAKKNKDKVREHNRRNKLIRILKKSSYNLM